MRRNPHTDPEQPVSRGQERRRRRRRSRLIMLRRLVAWVLMIVLVVVLWQNWDVLAPDKLLAKLQDSMDTSAGTFPVDISGTNVSVLDRSQNYITALSDSYLTFYNTTGGEVKRYACTYSSPLFRTAGKYVLLAEQNGKRVQLFTRSLMLTEITAKERILSVALNEKGQIAVLTRGNQSYAVQVTVYDRKGQEIYSRSRTKLSVSVALSPDGTHLSLLSTEATDGVLSSLVEVFALSGKDTQAVFSHTVKDTLLYRLEYMNDSRLAAVGETGALLVNTRNSSAVPYTVETQRVLGYAVKADGVALALRDYGDTADGRVVVVNHHGEERCAVDFTGEFRHLSTDGSKFLLLTGDVAQSITANGASKAASVEADGQQAVLSGNTAVVLGLSSIQSYTLG